MTEEQGSEGSDRDLEQTRCVKLTVHLQLFSTVNGCLRKRDRIKQIRYRVMPSNL